MPLIQEEIPNAKLVIVGKGPEKEKLEKLAAQIGADRGLTFTGWVNDSDLIKHIQNAEVVVVPSYWAESFSLVTLEAMAIGRPIVLSNIFGLSEQIEHNDVGFLFEAGNSKDLANKVINLLLNFELVKKLSERCMAKVDKLYSPELHYRNILEIYEKTNED